MDLVEDPAKALRATLEVRRYMAACPGCAAHVPLDARGDARADRAVGRSGGARRWERREISWTDRPTGLRSVSMGTVANRFAIAAELPLLLTVEEAAEVLRIGRTLAYLLARRYEVSGGVTGLPVFRLGGCLRVPRWALLELACSGRVVALSELVADTADLGQVRDEASVDPSEQFHQLVDVEQSASPKPKRPKRSASRAAPSVRVGQQLVLLPSE